MPDEPNKNMDELLRAYAEERRKAPPVELHPATRKMLQGEVGRVYGAREKRKSFWGGLRAFWPQIAFAGGLCVVLGIAVLSLRQPRQIQDKEAEQLPQVQVPSANAPSPMMEQKQNEKEEAATPPAVARATSDSERGLAGAAPAERPALAPARDIREEALADEKSLSRAGSAINPSSQPVPTKLHKEEVRLQRADTATQEKDISLQKKLEPLGSSAENRTRKATIAENLGRSPPPTASAPASSELINLGAARRLNFVQVNDGLAKRSPASATPILSTFSVEQLGTNVRFLDNDGSVYLGELQPTNATAAFAVATKVKNDDLLPGNGSVFAFKVQGTNRTLGQDLVLTGQYFENTNTVSAQLGAAAADAQSRRPQNQARYTIIGNATIGATSQVPVRAISNQR